MGVCWAGSLSRHRFSCVAMMSAHNANSGLFFLFFFLYHVNDILKMVVRHFKVGIATISCHFKQSNAERLVIHWVLR